jgi:hypothetical protein
MGKMVRPNDRAHLDVIHMNRFLHSRQMVQPRGSPHTMRVAVLQRAQVALEVAVVHGIEPHHLGEGANIGLREAVADQPCSGSAMRRSQVHLQPVQRCKQRRHVALVLLLSGGEAGLVHRVKFPFAH